jgi:hypothetical protein
VTVLHCADCDRYDCAGFTRPANTQPPPDPRPASLATPEQRAAHLEHIRAELAAAKHKTQGEQR